MIFAKTEGERLNINYDGSGKTVKVSVREITDFLFRSGSLSSDGAQLSNKAMLKGAEIHRRLQSKRQSEDGSYQTERKLSVTEEYQDFTYVISGQADGIKPSGDASIIDEFKTTYKNAAELSWDSFPSYSAQVMMYGYMYCLGNSLNFVTLRLSFYNYSGDSTETFEKEFTFTSLCEWFHGTLSEYHKWIKLVYEHRQAFLPSCAEMKFPFSAYRPGQRELAAKVYRCVRDAKRLFAQAPTGIGKTVSTLFPALKALGEEHGKKLFYLSAKTVAAKAALDCMGTMAKDGLKAKTIALTSKEKLCPFEKSCIPEDCQYCAGHYDRVNGALYSIAALPCEVLIDGNVITECAKAHRVCPFELQLDASEFCDVVIGDYNYFFDPTAHLIRYFEEENDYAVLCDEAHNLAERAREMYTARLSVLFLKSFSKHFDGFRKLKGRLKKCIEVFENYRIDLFATDKTDLKSFLGDEKASAVTRFCEAYADFLGEEGNADVKKATLELYFELSFFCDMYNLAKSLPDAYTEYIHREGNDCVYNLVCTDPSELIRLACSKVRSTVFFSATLSPFSYYLRMLGHTEDDECIDIPSPFPPENQLCCIYKNLSTRFRDRQNSLENVCDIVYKACGGKIGNYMVFFPSYNYMQTCFDEFCAEYPQLRCEMQTPNMTPEQKREFLNLFKPDPKETLIVFALCGGMFSEGVDLAGDRLSGAVIIGTGMPGISFERDLLKEHFDKALGEYQGFNYAYTYTGLNHVFQSGGRVIRSQSDVGFIVLADDRYMKMSHRRNFPGSWYGYKIVNDTEQLGNIINDFWKKHNG